MSTRTGSIDLFRMSLDVCSEYRQAEGSVVSNVALRLLTTDAPTETKQDLAASAQLVSSTGTAPGLLSILPACLPAYRNVLPTVTGRDLSNRHMFDGSLV